MTIPIIGYSRFSPGGKDFSIERQTEQIEAYVRFGMSTNRFQNHQFLGHLQDDEVSGSIPLFERPSGQHVPSQLAGGGVLIVTRIDRAFRSALDMEQSIAKLHDFKIELVVCEMMLDTGTKEGMAMLRVLTAFAELERQTIKARLASGTRHARITRGPFHKCCGWRIVGAKSDYRNEPHWAEREAIDDALARLRKNKNRSYVSGRRFMVQSDVINTYQECMRERGLTPLTSLQGCYRQIAAGAVGYPLVPHRVLRDNIREWPAGIVNHYCEGRSMLRFKDRIVEVFKHNYQTDLDVYDLGESLLAKYHEDDEE